MMDRFTIQRRSKPGSMRRFLAIDDDGLPAWADASAPFNVFESERAAETFRQFRLGHHAADAVVTRHAVH